MRMRVASVGGGVAVALGVAYLLTPPLARLDDAYIAVHSASVVLSGRDPVFGVAALVGATSPAYVALLVGILGSGVSSLTALRLANSGGLVAYVAAVWYLGGVVGLTRGRRLALLGMALTSGLVMLHLTNGMETGWAIAVLTFAVAAAYAGQTIAVACCVGLLPFLRPDLAPAAGLLLLYSLTRRPLSLQVRAVLLAVLIALPWLIWMRLDTGAWLPQTMRAKQLFFATGCWPWTTKASVVLGQTASALVRLFPLSVGLVVLWQETLGRVGLVAMAASLAAYFVFLPDVLSDNYSRYLYAILVPWLCYGTARLFASIQSGVAITGAIAVAAVFAATSRHDPTHEFASEMKASAEWLDAHLPGDAVLLVHDAGGISEFAHLRAVDLVGLKTPSSMAAHARWTWPTCGAARSTAFAAIVEKSGASHLVALTGWDALLRRDLEAEGFLLTPIRSEPSREMAYTVYRLRKRE